MEMIRNNRFIMKVSYMKSNNNRYVYIQSLFCKYRFEFTYLRK